MDLNLPEYRLLSPSFSELLSRIDVFCTHQWPEQNVFNNYKKISRAENFIAKIGDFCLLASTFILNRVSVKLL